MASVYLSSVDGNNSDDGSTWALADATLAAALTAAGAGGTVYVDNAHAEAPGSAITLTSSGTAASPTKILCVDRTGNPEPPTALATTATIATNGNAALNFAGVAISDGIKYSAGDAGGGGGSGMVNFQSTSLWAWTIINGQLEVKQNSATPAISVGLSSASSIGCKLTLINSPLKFAHVSQKVNIGDCIFEWRDTPSGIAGTVPTTLFSPLSAASNGRAYISGVDLSAAGSGKSLVDVGTNAGIYFRFENCKLGASVSITTGTHAGPGGVVVEVINCDSADTNYRYYRQDYLGTATHETTIVRTGGASDGTTGFSRKLVSSANTSFYRPMYSQWFKFWNETTGSGVTVPIEIVTDNVTLTDAEAWVEVEYLGTSGFPLSLSATDAAASIFASPANQTTSSETWTTTGLTTPVKQTLSKQVTPQEKGWIRARVCLAKASTTLYACPKILSTSAYQYMDTDGDIVNAPAAAGGSGGVMITGGMVGGMRS